MSPVTIGTEVEIVDELAPVVAPTATDGCFLIHSGATEVMTFTTAADAREEFALVPDLVALCDAFFGEGGAKLTVAPLNDGSGDDLASDLEALPADLGPGQVVAPEVTTGSEMAELAAWAFETNRIYIADGPPGAADGDLVTLAAAIRASDGARFAEVEADTLQIPGLASGTTRDVPAAIVKAALIARSDLATGNPNLAAAGANGQCRYVVGIGGERGDTARNTLAESGVNCFRSIYSGALIRAYGYRTTADPDDYPVWWDVSGSRVVMAVRARAAAVNEDYIFGQVDGAGAFLSAFETSLARELKDLQSVGALFAPSPTSQGYSVQAGWEINPRADLAQGKVRARIVLRTSPFAEHVTVLLIRRQITQEV